MGLHDGFAVDMNRPDDPVPPTPASKTFRMDGRRLRSERTKQLIIEAYLALIRETGAMSMPTAAEIAARAGYSVRSVFERFPDLHALRVAAADYSLAHAAALAPARDVGADRKTRIRSYVETRAGTCERGVALWRALLFNIDEDDALKQRVKVARERTVERMEVMFPGELATFSETERKRFLVALEAITDIESWARMREMHELSFAEACTVWVGVIDRILPAIPSDALPA